MIYYSKKQKMNAAGLNMKTIVDFIENRGQRELLWEVIIRGTQCSCAATFSNKYTSTELSVPEYIIRCTDPKAKINVNTVLSILKKFTSFLAVFLVTFEESMAYRLGWPKS